MARVAEVDPGLVADVRSHADLPKHAFGSCSICTRRLLYPAQQGARFVRGSRSSAAGSAPHLVQTGPLIDRSTGEG